MSSNIFTSTLPTHLPSTNSNSHTLSAELPSSSVIKTSQLMLYREIIAVCSQIHTKHINTACGQNVELLNVNMVLHIVTNGM